MLDRIRTRLMRDRDESGSAYLIVIVLVLTGFIFSSAMVAGATFAVNQTTVGRDNVAAQAAAEAGRDEVHRDFLTAANYTPAWCANPASGGGGPTGRRLGRTLPDGSTYTTRVFKSAVEASALTPDALKPSLPTGTITEGCPTASSKAVVIQSTGTTRDGRSKTVSAVYGYHLAETLVDLTGMHYNGLNIGAGSTFDGDQVVANGDFNCGAGGTVDGDVIVLNGNADIKPTGSPCRIKGNLYVSGWIKVESGFAWGDALDGNSTLTVDANVIAGRDFTSKNGLKIGGTLQVGGNVDITPYSSSLLLVCINATTVVGDSFSLPRTDPTILASGSVTLRDFSSACLFNPTPPGTVKGGVQAGGDIVGTKNWTVNGALTSGEDINLATVSGLTDVTATNTVTSNGSNQSGNLWAGGNVSGNSSVAGDLITVGNITKTGGTGRDLKSAGTITMSGGTYRNLEADSISKTGGTASGYLWAKTSASQTGGTAGEVRSAGTATLGGGTVTGVKANGAVAANNATVNGDILAGGNVTSTDDNLMTVNGKVETTGSVTAQHGFKVSKRVAANGNVSITQDMARETTIGDGSVSPAIISGASVSLLRECSDTQVTPVANVKGSVNASNGVTVKRCWTINPGQVRSPNNTIENNLDVITTPAVMQCRERNQYRGGFLWIYSGSFSTWNPNTTDTTLWPWTSTSQANCVNRTVNTSSTRQDRYEAEWAVRTPAVTTSQGVSIAGGKVTGSVASPGIASPAVAEPPVVTAPVVPTPPNVDASQNLPWMDVSASRPWTGYGTTSDSYYKATAADCTATGWLAEFLGWIGFDASAVVNSRAEARLIAMLSQTGPPVLFDTTACTQPLNLKFNTTPFGNYPIKRNAVLLVKNFKSSYQSFSTPGASDCTSAELTATPETCSTSTRPQRLFVIQPDETDDDRPTCAGRNPLELGLSGTWWNDTTASSLHIMYYAPCGISGGFANTIYGQLYVASYGGSGEIANALTKVKCRPMGVAGNFALGCRFDKDATNGDADAPSFTPSSFDARPTFQTE